MKTKLLIILTALVVSMIFSTVPTVLADSQLDSLVNIATQARTQVKLQLDRTDSVPSDIKALYEQGNSETELLINSVKQQDVEQSKQHFLSAMKIFKQISMTFSYIQTTVTPKAAIAPQVTQTIQAPPTADIDYKTSISRIENYVNTLKGLVTKNNISIDFTKIDELIQDAKVDLSKGDMTSVEKTYDELKNAITDTQNLIKEKANQKLIDRAKSFANEYVVRIDALINHAKELGISDDDVAKLKQVKEALSTTNDPSQIIVKIQRIITINVELKDSKNQKIIGVNKQTVQPDFVKTENASEKAIATDQNVKQEQKQKETKTQNSSQIDKLEARLTKLELSIDTNIQAKYDSAKSLLAKLKNQTPTSSIDQKTLKSLDSLIREIENYVDYQNAKADSNNTNQNAPTDSSKIDAKNPPDSVKPNLKPKHP
jgi:hypothetical protein